MADFLPKAISFLTITISARTASTLGCSQKRKGKKGESKKVLITNSSPAITSTK